MRRTSLAAPAPTCFHGLPSRVVLLSAVLLLSSCAVLSPPPPRSGGDGLKAAARETRKQPEDQKPLAAGVPTDGGSESTVVVEEVESRPCEEPERPVRDRESPRREAHRRILEGWHVGLVTGGTVGGLMLEPAGEVGLRIGRELGPGTSADLDLIGGPRRFRQTSGLAGAFDDPFEFAADLSLRHTLTRADGRSLGLAPLVGVRFGSLFWSYHNGLLVDDGGGPTPVQDDFLDTYSPYVGLGLTLLDSPRGQLGAAVKTGVRFYDRHTWEGLRNDAFATTGFVQVQLETRFPF